MSVFSYSKQALEVLSTIAVTAAAGVLIWVLLSDHAGGDPTAQITEVDGLSLESQELDHVHGGGEVAIVEFSDFECPFCNRYAVETLPELKRTLIEPGLVRYVSFHFPLEALHPNALDASYAAECAGQQAKYWEMHELLFSDPSTLARPFLFQYADDLGLDREAFEACLNDPGERVRAHQALGARLGVNATPSFFVGTVRDDGGIDLVRRINGFAAPDVFRTALDDLIPEQTSHR